MPLDNFHPAVAAWFRGRFGEPTPAQREAWPAIQSGRHALIAAPTGSGKTLAAFLAAIDALVRRGVAGNLPDRTSVVYVSPLKALSNDIQVNLEAPLLGVRDELLRLWLPDVEIRTMVRTGDTPAPEREQMKRRPPHIVVTTPESLYILLGSDSGRRMLASTETVIVDEIHALAPNKRGAHLALSLERLDDLCDRRLVRIGLSATQRPLERMARFLTGAGGFTQGDAAGCHIVDTGHERARDLAIELPETPLEALLTGAIREQIQRRIAELALAHRTTLLFVNTRREVERSARALGEILGKAVVGAHHGSLSRASRLSAEQRLKRGELRLLVATASLELGIDIGDVDLVCQLGSPHAIATFLQRAGRAGHGVGRVPKARLFPTTRDDLVECAALLDGVRRGELDELPVPPGPRDVLAQQLVAEVACREWHEDALFDLVRRAMPYAALPREAFDAIVRMLADGFSSRFGRRAAWLHRDGVYRVLRARRGARLTAITSGGAIPDTADYDVLMEPENLRVGSVNEDFAVESLAGDIFQLGNQSYRILRVERGNVRVEDAHGAPPTIPFWIGEAPGRSEALSAAVSRLRGEVATRLDGSGAARWLGDEAGVGGAAATQIAEYLAAVKAELGFVPTQNALAMERFFDESGGMQLVIHSPWGSRINRAWGLALRKRFCRKFNFELQAAANEDAIVLSLSTSHSFPLADVARYLSLQTVRDVLVQAVLTAPMFGLRWRWNATTALALPRFSGGRRVPPQLQRMRAEDLLAAVFPDQVACAENLTGERVVPDHPLVAQTLEDCIEGAMDVDGLAALLTGLESGAITISAHDLAAPSPLAAEILRAMPHAFLDDAPAEERRTQAVAVHRPGDATGTLDGTALDDVSATLWPDARSHEDVHAVLLELACVTDSEANVRPGWTDWLAQLAQQRRAARFDAANDGTSPPLWVAAERLAEFDAVLPGRSRVPSLSPPVDAVVPEPGDALQSILRSRLSASAPVTADHLARTLGVLLADIEIALASLEQEGTVFRGHITADAATTEWCERAVLQRIRQTSVTRRRRAVEPAAPSAFIRFLAHWQHVAPAARMSGPNAVAAILAQLEGFEAPAAAWEAELLRARIDDYDIAWLDGLCLAGRIVWRRLRPRAAGADGRNAPLRVTPIVLLPRGASANWIACAARTSETAGPLSSRAQAVAERLASGGASFFAELQDGAGLLASELEDALGELAANGMAHADSFAGLRALMARRAVRRSAGHRRLAHATLTGIADAGRWSLTWRSPDVAGTADPEPIARTLLRRYGVVAFPVLAREAGWLPRWRELVAVWRRLEAAGEILGGRFVTSVAGEQFALPDAAAMLRKFAQPPGETEWVCVSGADPLNLVGHVVAGDAVPAATGNRVVYRDGVPVGTRVAGRMVASSALDAADSRIAHGLLLRGTRPRMVGTS